MDDFPPAIDCLAQLDNDGHGDPLASAISHFVLLLQNLVALPDHKLFDYHPVCLVVLVLVQLQVLIQLLHAVRDVLCFLQLNSLLALVGQLGLAFERVCFVALFEVLVTPLSLLVRRHLRELCELAHLVILMQHRVQLSYQAAFGPLPALDRRQHFRDGLSVVLLGELDVSVLQLRHSDVCLDVDSAVSWAFISANRNPDLLANELTLFVVDSGSLRHLIDLAHAGENVLLRLALGLVVVGLARGEQNTVAVAVRLLRLFEPVRDERSHFLL